VKNPPVPWGRRVFLFKKGVLTQQLDGLAKSRKRTFRVIPAKAGIQAQQAVLDPGVRRGDGVVDFLSRHQT